MFNMNKEDRSTLFADALRAYVNKLVDKAIEARFAPRKGHDATACNLELSINGVRIQGFSMDESLLFQRESDTAQVMTMYLHANSPSNRYMERVAMLRDGDIDAYLVYPATDDRYSLLVGRMEYIQRISSVKNGLLQPRKYQIVFNELVREELTNV